MRGFALVFFLQKGRNCFSLVIGFVLKCLNHPSFVNISPTVIDTTMERSSRVLQHGNPKKDFLNAYLSVSAVIFCKQCLAYTVHIDWCYPLTFM